jgi:hypothetical protein
LAASCLHTRARGAPCPTLAYSAASAYLSVGPGQAASARGPTAGTRTNASRTPSPDPAACRPALAPPADGACVQHHLAPPRSRPPPRMPLSAPLPRLPRQARALPLKTRAVAVGSIFSLPLPFDHPAPRVASKASQARPAAVLHLPTPFLQSHCTFLSRPSPRTVVAEPPDSTVAARHGCEGRYRAVPVQAPGEAASGPTFANNRSRVSPWSFLASSRSIPTTSSLDFGFPRRPVHPRTTLRLPRSFQGDFRKPVTST